MSAGNSEIRVEFFSDIGQIPETEWNRLNTSDYPFSQYGFLRALETSQCVGSQSGWRPEHIGVYRGEDLIALMPCYQKDHSYGEYVFDWSWAQAYAQSGLDYYPKLISAIPFTPVPGPRLLCDEQEDKQRLMAAIFEAVQNRAVRLGYSSWHLLFAEAGLIASCTDLPLLVREDVQFHWRNYDFDNFDAFLATLRSSKRKQIKRERRIVADQKVELKRYSGADIAAEVLDSFYLCYQQTYLRRSGHGGYLNRAFFEQILSNMGEQILIVLGWQGNEAIAASLFFFDSTRIYGRYWGSLRDIDCLHFEACYYQGIEFAIEHKLKEFNPGTQGEHKLVRGFEPTITRSLHWIENAEFRMAIKQFLRRESAHKNDYQKAAREYLPFRHSDQHPADHSD